MKGATFQYAAVDGGKSGFNPRAREGRDAKISELFADKIVSIHAPVKGATVGDVATQFTNAVSIHAPVKGATQRPTHLLQIQCFNPRAREGRDKVTIENDGKKEVFQSTRP